ncbi:hypothetical protein MIZ03_4658 [Rhodoferax lithotrophicus]|uniref:Uncharacterized protein n=1 Tax=Rhodoferax lithotrophicus TaxID=2798804 RepID=A0ABM7MU61_9BURK|nr:hypothetical protein MIZ03_4658 [Rhodoferax sp. MIZ03]
MSMPGKSTNAWVIYRVNPWSRYDALHNFYSSELEGWQ